MAADDFTKDMVEGQLRMRLTCDLCQVTLRVDTELPEEQREWAVTLIREYPGRALGVARACAHVVGWLAVPLEDGSTWDVCPECRMTNPLMGAA